MEELQFLRNRAYEKIKVADYMLSMTYPLVKDPKLLLSILENVHASHDYAIGALLHHDKLFKKIPPFQESFQSRYEVFRTMSVPMHKLNPSYMSLVANVKNLLSEHKKSPVAFSKKDKLVICSPSYSIKTIDMNIVKRFIFETKLFVDNVNVIVSKNERIFI